MPPHYHFHLNLLAAPPAELFACTWEEAAAQLERLPRMIFEPDGSFVLTGTRQRAGTSPPLSSRWQVDGHLFDLDDRLWRVELRGHCPPKNFDDLLRCLGWPGQQLAFEMIRTARRLDEPTFRHHASTTTPPPP